MCNEHRVRFDPASIVDSFTDLHIPARWADGAIPNLQPREDVRIGDSSVIARGGAAGVTLSATRWAWKGPAGKPVFNFRSEGRDFSRSDRCLILTNGFYEFTAPADPKRKRKDKHLFTLAGEPWFFIAGIVRDGAFAMLTCAPGPDMAPYHDRQVVVLRPRDGAAWLDLTRPEADLLRPTPSGGLVHEAVETAPTQAQAPGSDKNGLLL